MKYVGIALLAIALVTGVSFAAPGVSQNAYADCDAGDE
jgi:hypothetical protein